ncbi:MAG: hypothetical protein AAF493_07165 [Pseudomonadota bacterium]
MRKPGSTRRARDVERERGLALILVLWVLMLLTLIAGSFSFSMRNETVIAGNLRDRVQAGALAEAGIERVLYGLSFSGTDPEFATDGVARRLVLEGGEVRVVIRAERAKIDINRTSEEVLRALGERVVGSDDADAFADSVLDWRDRNDKKRLNGAEDDDYRALGFAYGARDGHFMTVNELTQLPLVTDEVFEQLAPLVSVEAKSRRVNALTATKDVLLAVPGLTEENIDRLIEARAEENPSVDLKTLIAGAEQHVELRDIRGRRELLNIVAEGRTEAGAVAHRQVTLRFRRNRPTIMTWSRTADGVNFQTAEELDIALADETKSVNE